MANKSKNIPMYVYLDEVTFGDCNQYSGYGALITRNKITVSIIEDALSNLENDPDIDGEIKDKTTLSRKYFHASDDSKNAHSHLCNSINNHLVGKFTSHFFHTNEHDFRSTEDAYDLASKLSISSVLSQSLDITFIFEERNDLTESSIKTWWSTLWNDLLKSQYRHPEIKTYYPKLNFIISNKSEPGLQVVDFILWANSRQLHIKKCPWFNRLKAWLKTNINPIDQSWSGHTLWFRQKEDEKDIEYSTYNFQPIVKNMAMSDFYANAIIHAQKVINHVYMMGPHKETEHLWNIIEYLEKSKIQHGNREHIKKLSECFLKLFDNISLINSDTSEHDESVWLQYRSILAFTQHSHNIEGLRHSIYLSDIRNEIIKKAPELLHQSS